MQRIKKHAAINDGTHEAPERGQVILKHAFLRAPQDVFEQILESGLDTVKPIVDLDDSFALSTDHYVPMDNSISDLELLVFLIIVPEQFRVPRLKSIPIREIPPGHHLPIGVATVTNMGYDQKYEGGSYG